MFSKTTLLTLAAIAAVEAAAPQGFNYGATFEGAPRSAQSWYDNFNAAQKLQGAPGTFNSARLYTMVSALTPGSPIEALKAAMDTKTYLLLGLWASGDSKAFDTEISVLSSVVKDPAYADLAQYILGISVGSEDLYRISEIGLKSSNPGPGNGPDVITSYIKRAREAISGSGFSKVPVGHVDTWTAWVNGTNAEVITNSDFLGVDAYPYFQNTQANSIENAPGLFNEAMDNTKGVAQGKEVWITETGWPITGAKQNLAYADTNDAQTYWQEVGCANFGSTPTFWYTLFDGVAPTDDPMLPPSFSLVKDESSFEPVFSLSCSNVKNNSSTNSTSSSTAISSGFSTATASGSASTGTGSSGSGATNGSYTGSPSQPSTTGTSTSGSGSSGSGSSSGSAASGSSSAGVNTSGASSLSFSLTSMAAVAAAVAAFL